VPKTTHRSGGDAPLSDAAHCFRRCMSRFATGVTVITTSDGEGIHGMTANGFLSASLSPPLVVVSLGACRMSNWLEKTGRFVVNVLAEEQASLSAHFANAPMEAVTPRFSWHDDFPLLEGAVAHIGASVHDTHQVGDHTLWIGLVEHMEYRDSRPLLFYTGAYGSLREPPEEKILFH
jgi:flavin reductase (DIM6/NTAB) family NADH-FMN oxidoreductase RutF